MCACYPSIHLSIYLSILDYLSVHASKCVKLVQGQRSWFKDIDCFEFTALTTCKLQPLTSVEAQRDHGQILLPPLDSLATHREGSETPAPPW